MDKINKNWEKFLSSKKLKDNLISISLFLTAFKMFKERVIELPEVFFINGFNEKGEFIFDKRYRNDVLSKNKSKLYASLLWLKELSAIEQTDISNFDEIRQHRNELAHKPFAFITDSDKNIDLDKFVCLINLLCKIEKWWFVNFEYPLNVDDYGDHPIDFDGVMTPSQWQLKLLLDIALGNEPEENFYLDSIVNRNI